MKGFKQLIIIFIIIVLMFGFFILTKYQPVFAGTTTTTTTSTSSSSASSARASSITSSVSRANASQTTMNASRTSTMNTMNTQHSVNQIYYNNIMMYHLIHSNHKQQQDMINKYAHSHNRQICYITVNTGDGKQIIPLSKSEYEKVRIGDKIEYSNGKIKETSN